MCVHVFFEMRLPDGTDVSVRRPRFSDQIFWGLSDYPGSPAERLACLTVYPLNSSYLTLSSNRN